ncbi:Necrosis inducing protein [Phytophthora cactorum]|nr:Necrosis inducing protein [Phytophthora cactorum]
MNLLVLPQVFSQHWLLVLLQPSPQLNTPRKFCVPFPAVNAAGGTTGGLNGTMETTQVSMLLWALRSTEPARDAMTGRALLCDSVSNSSDLCRLKLLFADWDGEYQDLIMWEQLTDAARAALNDDNNFGNAEVPFSDAHYEKHLEKSWPSSFKILELRKRHAIHSDAGDRRRRYCGRFVITTTVKRVANRCYGLLPLAEIAMPLVIGLVGSAGGYRIHVVVDPIALFRFVERPSKREFRFPDKRLLHGRAVEESTKYLEPVIPLRRHRGSELLTAWRTFSVHANNVERVVLVCKHNTENLVPLLQFTVDRILARIEAQAVVTLEKAVVRFPALEYEALTLL